MKGQIFRGPQSPHFLYPPKLFLSRVYRVGLKLTVSCQQKPQLQAQWVRGGCTTHAEFIQGELVDIPRMWYLPSLVLSSGNLLLSHCYASSNLCVPVQQVKEHVSCLDLISPLGTNYGLLSVKSIIKTRDSGSAAPFMQVLSNFQCLPAFCLSALSSSGYYFNFVCSCLWGRLAQIEGTSLSELEIHKCIL